MKLLKRCIERDASGYVQLVAEDPQDMWHMYNLLFPADRLRASTLRRVQSTSTTGSTDSQRLRLTLTITVTAVDFDVHACQLRVQGRVCEECAHVKMGAFHTLDLELHHPFTVTKTEWDSMTLQRITDACDVTQRAEVAAVCMHEGLSLVCLLTEYMTVVRQRVEVHVPKKRRGTSTHYDQGLVKFFDQTLEAMVTHIRMDVVKAVIVASPGFLRDQFLAHVWHKAAQRSDLGSWFEHRHKFMSVHSTSGHKHALEDVLQDPSVQQRLSATKYARECQALGAFFRLLNDQPDRAFYGMQEVQKACEAGAVATLLVSDALLRQTEVAVRKKVVALIERCQQLGADVFVFSSLHVSGEQLSAVTGVACMTRFALDLDAAAAAAAAGE